MTDQEGQFNFNPPNAFTDTSQPAQDLVNDISKIMGGGQNKSSLSNSMQQAARMAGIEARSAKTIEGEQDIYKKHLPTNASSTSGEVVSWERLAKQTRNSK